MKGKFMFEGGPLDGEMRSEINMPPDRHRVAIQLKLPSPFSWGSPREYSQMDYVVAYTNGDVTVLQPDSVDSQ